MFHFNLCVTHDRGETHDRAMLTSGIVVTPLVSDDVASRVALSASERSGSVSSSSFLSTPSALRATCEGFVCFVSLYGHSQLSCWGSRLSSMTLLYPLSTREHTCSSGGFPLPLLTTGWNSALRGCDPCCCFPPLLSAVELSFDCTCKRNYYSPSVGACAPLAPSSLLLLETAPPDLQRRREALAPALSPPPPPFIATTTRQSP